VHDAGQAAVVLCRVTVVVRPVPAILGSAGALSTT
jgi:hypothetical protein